MLIKEWDQREVHVSIFDFQFMKQLHVNQPAIEIQLPTRNKAQSGQLRVFKLFRSIPLNPEIFPKYVK